MDQTLVDKIVVALNENRESRVTIVDETGTELRVSEVSIDEGEVTITVATETTEGGDLTASQLPA